MTDTAPTGTVSFGYEDVAPDEKTARVGGVFSSVAKNYDLMNDAMSGGMHRLWKDRFVRRLQPREGEQILDMAGGTGDIAFRMARIGREVTVADINPDMLAVGMERADKRGHRQPGLDRANAETLTFPDRSSTPTPSPSASGTSPISPARCARRIACCAAAAASSASNSRPTTWPGFKRKSMTAIRTRSGAQARPAAGAGCRQLSLSDRIDPPLPRHADVQGHDRRRRLRADEGGTDHWRPRRDPFGLEDLMAHRPCSSRTGGALA
jgi:demethylmenaquinone methyltransferase / 2-methoxy-6-polyprenyl-1,4-benzoquinol methylase